MSSFGRCFRSLPTNIRDIPHTINTNSIRSQRTGSFAAAMGEGGNSYSASTNIDNFVEERSDKMYSHDTGKKRIDLNSKTFGDSCGLSIQGPFRTP